MEISKLSSVCKIFGGYAFPSTSYVESEVPLIRISNVKSNNEVVIDKSVSIKFEERFSNYVIQKQDILIALSGATTGKFGIYDSDEISYLNQRVGLLRANENINQRYLFYYFNLIQDEILRKAGGAAQPNISTTQLGEFQIPLPPLETQKAIAEKLDKADALRKKDKELLKQYDELAQSIFIDMFGDPVQNEKGWEKVKLSDLIERLETGVSVNSSDEFSDYKILKTSCVYTGEFNPNESKYIIEKDLVRAKLNPTIDSIIISRMNTTELVCKCSYINKTYSDIFLPDRLWQTVKGKLKHNVRWLSFVLGYETFLREIQKKSSGTSGSMKNISKTAYLDTDIIYPPLELQNQFAEKIKNIEAQKELVKKQAEASENLFQALLQESFNFK